MKNEAKLMIKKNYKIELEGTKMLLEWFLYNL